MSVRGHRWYPFSENIIAHTPETEIMTPLLSKIGECRVDRNTAVRPGNDGSALASARTAAAQTITEFPIPIRTADSIVAGPDGALWFAAQAGQNKIGRITTAGAVTEFPIPVPSARVLRLHRHSCRPRRRAMVWLRREPQLRWLWPGEWSIGRITTTGEFSEFPLPPASISVIAHVHERNNGWPRRRVVVHRGR